jgi:hypothetical protein
MNSPSEFPHPQKSNVHKATLHFIILPKYSILDKQIITLQLYFHHYREDK